MTEALTLVVNTGVGTAHGEKVASTTLPELTLRQAWQRSRLLREVKCEGLTASHMGISFASFTKWLDVAGGSSCEAGDAAEVLRVATLLEDEDTRDRMLVAIATRFATTFAASPAYSLARRTSAVPADDTPASGVDDGAVAEVLRMADMHPQDLFAVLRHVPPATIAHLPPPLLLEGLVSHIAGVQMHPGSTAGWTSCADASVLAGPGRTPWTTGTLHIYDATCCEAAQLLFQVPHVPAGMLRALCLHVATAGTGSDRLCFCCDRRAQCEAGTDDCEGCSRGVLALACALRANAASLQQLSLANVYLSSEGADELVGVFKEPDLALRVLRMHDVRFPGQLHMRQLLVSCTALTSLRIQGIEKAVAQPFWVRPSTSPLDLSAMPNLRHLAVSGRAVPASMDLWGLEYLQHLEELEAGASANEGYYEYPQSHIEMIMSRRLAGQLCSCTALRVLRCGFWDFADALSLLSKQLPHLERVCMRPHGWPQPRSNLMLRTGWLGRHLRLQDVEIVGWDWLEVDMRELSSAVAVLPRLTRLHLESVRVIGWEPDACARVLASSPRLEVICLRSMLIKRAADREPQAARRADAAAGLTDAQRRWLDVWSLRRTHPMRAAYTPYSVLQSLEISGPLICTFQRRVAYILDKGRSCLMRAFVVNSPHLTHLDLSATGVGAGLSDLRSTQYSLVPDTQPLLSALANLPCLRRLSLASNGIDDSGALSVLRVLRRLPALESVDCRCNDVSVAPGLYELRELLGNWPCARALACCTHSTHSVSGVCEVDRTPDCIVDLSEICLDLFP
eukprot:jgi/Ulvmu1/8737/UM047_0078.1